MPAWAAGPRSLGVLSCQSVAQAEVKFKMSQRLERNARNARLPQLCEYIKRRLSLLLQKKTVSRRLTLVPEGDTNCEESVKEVNASRRKKV